ncbi:MAG TPA: FHA domain-containing protein [Gaiellaceae bacterium]|nr:FHA domain-containing protein [Gaiellaceae bacterium]
MTPARPVLRVTAGGREIVLDGGETVTVGREQSAGIVIEDERVSRVHAVLRLEPDGWVLEDEDSRNGTFCDGRRVGRVEVAGGLVVRLGDPATGPRLELTPVRREEPEAADSRRTLLDARTLGAGAAPAPPAELGRLTGVHAVEQVVRIGRAPDNDVVVGDLLVSRRHAELRGSPSRGYELVDLGSHNGTFVNGRRHQRAQLEPLDVVGVGRHSFRLVDGLLEEYEDVGDVTFAARGLTVRTPTGAVVLDDVGFHLRERSLLAVVGPSGAGKSTLLGALTGYRPAQQGSVLYAGRDLYADYDELAGRIGLVPQDDVLHPELTVERALGYAAELRFPADVPEAERSQRVGTVIEELGLADRRGLRIGSLSGGQRKRTSVALELLTKPSLLFLDEPTSGLDPGLERSLMELLRALADGGRTVVVVTHSVQSLRLCDRVLFLAPGGRTAYFGPAQLALAYFGREDFQEVFQDLGSGETDWPARFRAHPLHARYVEPDGQAEQQPAEAREAPTPRGGSFLRQLGTLSRRYVRVIAGDRRALALLALQAPLLGLLMLVALPADELAQPPFGELRLLSKAGLVLLIVIMGATWLGASNATREIVKELPVYRRERAVGLSIPAYVGSKALVLGALTIVQAIVLVLLATARQGGPVDAAVLGWPLGELLAVVAATGVAGMALGLLVSALASRVDRAMAVLPILLLVELILAMGAVFPDLSERPVLKQAGYLAGTQWGFAASASTVDLNALEALNDVAREFPTVDLRDPGALVDGLDSLGEGEGRWEHEPGRWLTAMLALAGLTAAGLVGAGLALRRYDPDVA